MTPSSKSASSSSKKKNKEQRHERRSSSSSSDESSSSSSCYPCVYTRIESAQKWIKGPNHEALMNSETSVRANHTTWILSSVRSRASHNDDEQQQSCGILSNLFHTIHLFIINSYATILVFIFYLITVESIVSMSFSVGFTIYIHHTKADSSKTSSFDGGIMDWILLSFAIVTPMNSSIGFAFKRREEALNHLAKIRSLVFCIYQAHSTWDWSGRDPSGREKSSKDVHWENHSDIVLHDLLELCDGLCRYLTLPTIGRARHRVTPKGKQHAIQQFDVMEDIMLTLLTKVNHLSLHCEILKMYGMPGNESSRIRQWECYLIQTLEQLQVIKEYRTPQALRSLCRIFSVVLPPLYSPYYAQMAHDLQSLPTAVVFSALTSLVLTALFESLTQMEDPFVAHITLDGIDVSKELNEKTRDRLLLQRNHVFFPNSKKNGNNHNNKKKKWEFPREEQQQKQQTEEKDMCDGPNSKVGAKDDDDDEKEEQSSSHHQKPPNKKKMMSLST